MRTRLLPLAALALVVAPACHFDTVLARDGEAALSVAEERALANVLLLLDTSGSMENGFDDHPSRCSVSESDVAETMGADDRTKWIALEEALTGTFTEYRCASQQRAGPGFVEEFRASDAAGAMPYDANYYLEHRRPLVRLPGSDTLCAIGPDNYRPSSWLATFADHGDHGVFWPGDASSAPGAAPGLRTYAVAKVSSTAFAVDHARDDASGDCPSLFSADFPQNADGLLDAYRDRLRFGMMTFDTLPDARVGATKGAKADLDGGGLGNYSYFRGWYAENTDVSCAKDGAACECAGIEAASGARCAAGRPPNCALSGQEVGARNAAAPPWEGRMTGFGGVHSLEGLRDHNARLQRTIHGVRPYGATPLAGMLEDAMAFVEADRMPDYESDPALGDVACDGDAVPCMGVAKGAVDASRATHLVLVSDGAPNLDLRPTCEQKGDAGGEDGVCPYRTPVDTAAALAKDGFAVHVVGVGLAGCAAKAAGGDLLDAAGFCGGADEVTDELKRSCCTLARVARAGGTVAVFAEDPATLRQALDGVFSSLAK
jgi:type IV pilus assembly protein PilY1